MEIQRQKLNMTTASSTEFDIALEIATVAHAGQKDKVGEDYIKHPTIVSSYCKTERGKIAALLHDVIEDTEITVNDLRASGISEDIIMAVKCLTKAEGENLDAYYSRVALNDIATEVKFADMRHNSEMTRFPSGMKKEAEENYWKYLGRAKELCKIAGLERTITLITDESYAWLEGANSPKKPKRKTAKERNEGRELKDVHSMSFGEGKVVKYECYAQKESGEIFYIRQFTDGTLENISKDEKSGYIVTGCYPAVYGTKGWDFSEHILRYQRNLKQ